MNAVRIEIECTSSQMNVEREITLLVNFPVLRLLGLILTLLASHIE